MVRFPLIGKAFFIGQRRRNLYPLNHVLNLISSFFVTSISLISKHRLDFATHFNYFYGCVCTCSGNVKRILKGPFLFNATIYVFFFLDPLFKYKRLMFGCIANLKLLLKLLHYN